MVPKSAKGVADLGLRQRKKPMPRKIAAGEVREATGQGIILSSSWTGTSKSRQALYGTVVALLTVTSIFYGVLVLDIAREYAFENVPTDPTAFHIGNLWESFFTKATTEELGVGIHGISRQRKAYVDSWISVVCHWVGGGILMFVGPFQFIDALRDRFTTLHKVSGYLYYVGAALSNFGALFLYLEHPMKTEMYGGYVFSLPLFLLALISLRANVEAIRSVLRKKRSIRRHMTFNAFGFCTFLTAPWLRVLWIAFPRIYRFLGASIEDWNNMEIVNLLSEPFVLSPMILLALVFLSGQNKFASSERLRLWKLSGKMRNLFFLWAIVTVAAVAYQMNYRFVDSSNHFFTYLNLATAPDLAAEYAASQKMYFSGFPQDLSATNNPLLAGLLSYGVPSSPLPYTYSYLGSLLLSLLLGPVILHQTTHRGRSGTITSIAYTLSLLVQSVAAVTLEVLADGRGFGGCVLSSITCCQLACWWFCWLMLVYFGFIRGDPRMSRAWAVFTVAAGQGTHLFNAVLFPVLALALDHSLYSATLTTGMLASSVPFVEAYSFVCRPSLP